MYSHSLILSSTSVVGKTGKTMFGLTLEGNLEILTRPMTGIPIGLKCFFVAPRECLWNVISFLCEPFDKQFPGILVVYPGQERETGASRCSSPSGRRPPSDQVPTLWDLE
jgi:hypothetical protein